MKRLLLVAACMLVLPAIAAAQSPEQVCYRLGYVPGTRLFLDCTAQMAARYESLPDRLMRMGTILQQQAQPYYYQPRMMQTTTCRWLGGQYVCNTW